MTTTNETKLMRWMNSNNVGQVFWKWQSMWLDKSDLRGNEALCQDICQQYGI